MRRGEILNRTSKTIPEGERLMSDFFKRARHKFRINAIVGDGYQEDLNYTNSISQYDGVNITMIKDFSEHNSLRPSISRGMFSLLIEPAPQQL